VAILIAAGVTGLLVTIMLSTAGGQQVYWFAGFTPSHGVALGIDFAVDELNSGLAALTATLVTAALIFSWRYFERVSTYYHALMLIFLAGMVGFCLTGDVFNLFVWFKAALFLCVDIVLHRLGSVNETTLHGRGRRLPVTGVIFGLAALALADLPPFALYRGAEASEETSETDEAKGRTPLSMIVPPIALVALALVVGLLPQLGALVQDGAVRFQDQAAYNATVLAGAHIAHPTALLAPEDTSVTTTDVVTGCPRIRDKSHRAAPLIPARTIHLKEIAPLAIVAVSSIKPPMIISPCRFTCT